MKKTFIALSMAAVLVPAVAGAQDATVNAAVRAEVRATTTKPYMPLPKLGPVIKEINKNATTTRAEAKADMQVKIQEHREAARERAEEAKARAKERFGAQVQKAVGNIVDRPTKAADELANVAVRIDAYIEVQQDKGNPMTASVAALATADTSIAAAQTSIGSAAVAIDAALGNADPKAQMARVRAAVKAAEDALKSAKRSLQEALKTVRIEVAATSTTTVQ